MGCCGNIRPEPDARRADAVDHEGAANVLGRSRDIDQGAGTRNLPGECVKRCCGCRIEQRHKRKIENEGLGALSELFQYRGHTGGSAGKRKPPKCDRRGCLGRSSNWHCKAPPYHSPADHRPAWPGLFDFHRLRDSIEKHECAEPESAKYSSSKIVKNRQQESDEKNGGIAARAAQQNPKRPPFRHRPADDRKDPRQERQENLARGAAANMNKSKNSACSIPATGPLAPALIFAAVRAIVPVTQNPPNKAEPMFTNPCATSSALER
jgi:hypothetical protein